MAAWLASKCETAGRREGYIKELQKYIDIDVFGRCGKRPLPRSIEGQSGPDAIVLTYRNLLGPYYFYMSFEVSIECSEGSEGSECSECSKKNNCEKIECMIECN